MRRKFIAGNWKMYTNARSARELAAEIVKGFASSSRVELALCPPFPYLRLVADEIKKTTISLGAQNLYPEREGAYTGEVSPAMLLDIGCRYVILGHSERRHVIGESDEFISRKVRAALASGLHVILCVGETLTERESDATQKVLDRQIHSGFQNVGLQQVAQMVIAYEPVWAIGTGRNASPGQAQESHAYIRGLISKLLGEKSAAAVPIQYGGSVKPENAALLLAQADVDGALVGGASLKADSFLAIVQAAAAVR
jgi:triosephosphate isomerase (TIM)